VKFGRRKIDEIVHCLPDSQAVAHCTDRSQNLPPKCTQFIISASDGRDKSKMAEEEIISIEFHK